MELVIQKLQLTNGRIPFDEWLNSLDSRSQAVVNARITSIRSGNLRDCKNVGGRVFELRIDFGPGLRVDFGKTRSRNHHSGQRRR
jgi:putative addiction module killer protein